MTYGEAPMRSAQLAHALQAGRRAARAIAWPCRCEKSPEALMVYLACVRSGAVLLPMNPGYTAGRGRPPRRRRRADRGARRRSAGRAAPTPPTPAAHGSTITSARPTIWPRSSTPAAPPAGRRAPCCRTATSRRTRRRCTDCGASSLSDVLLHALPIFHTHGLFVATNTSVAERHADGVPRSLRRRRRAARRCRAAR